VAIGVIDLLELVDIAENHGEGIAADGACADQLLNHQLQVVAIPDACQAVGAGQGVELLVGEIQFLLIALAFGDVSAGTEQIAQAAVIIGHRQGQYVTPDGGVVCAEVLQLPPKSLGLAAMPAIPAHLLQVGLHALAGFSRMDLLECLGHRLLRAEPAQPFHRGAHIGDLPSGGNCPDHIPGIFRPAVDSALHCA
jgi:hypothetical protein